MNRTLALLLAFGLTLPAVADAGQRVRLFTGHVYELGRGHDRGHRHGPLCRHARHLSGGPGCREVTRYARLPDGHRVPVRRTICRDRYGRSYELPNSARVIRRGRHGR